MHGERAANALDRRQWNHHERTDVKAHNAEKILFPELIADRFRRLFGIEQLVVLAHAARFIDDENQGPVFLLSLGLFGLQGDQVLDRRAAIRSGRETRLTPQHEKSLSLRHGTLDGREVARSKFFPLDIIKDHDAVSRRWRRGRGWGLGSHLESPPLEDLLQVFAPAGAAVQ